MKKIVFFGCIVVLILFDILTKWFFHGPFQEQVFWYSSHLFSYFPIVWEYLWIRLVYNPWVAFWLRIKPVILQVLTFAIIIALWYYYSRYESLKRNIYIDSWFICIFSGALPHAYERIFIGHVVDFLSIKHFAVCNMADIYITLWAILLLIAYMHEWRK